MLTLPLLALLACVGPDAPPVPLDTASTEPSTEPLPTEIPVRDVTVAIHPTIGSMLVVEWTQDLSLIHISEPTRPY